MRRLFALLPVLALTAACGGGNDITGPTVNSTPSSRVPSVAGNYFGTTSISFPELARSVSCSTTTTVSQSGSSVNLAPLQMGGGCGVTSIPLGSATIDASGSIGNESGSYNEPSCGLYTYSVSGGFFGRDLRISMIANSRTCYNMNITINLTKQ